MSMQTTLDPVRPIRPRPRPLTPFEAGLPDPRPVTDYTAVHSVVAGKSRITITLASPCVVRTPAWKFIDCTDGSKISAPPVVVVSNTVFYFEFGGLLSTAVAFVDVPPQDMQVQNNQGGFVRGGGQWFRMPVIS